jgi:hypothetical protein
MKFFDIFPIPVLNLLGLSDSPIPSLNATSLSFSSVPALTPSASPFANLPLLSLTFPCASTFFLPKRPLILS